MGRHRPAMFMTNRIYTQCPDSHYQACQRGIALVIVLWVIVLLTVVVSSFVYSVRTHVQMTGNQESLARARNLADAGVNRALYELLKAASDGGRWKAEGNTYTFDLDGTKVSVIMVPESTFIDLNTAPEKLLLGMFESVGVEAGQAQALVDAIEDWRDPDDLPRLSGAERDQYQAAGLKQVPANADFKSVSELKEVMGVTPEIYAKVADSLTVFSQAAGINSALAPRQVLLSIPDTKQEDVDAYLADRQSQLESGMVVMPFPAAAGFEAGSSSVVYNISSKAVLTDGTVFVSKAVVRLTGDVKHPFAFLDWREGRP